MKTGSLYFCVFIFLFFSQSHMAHAQHAAYTLERKISLPGNGGYDYLFVDDPARRLYVSHGDQVQVIDLNTEKLIGAVTGLQGVHGIAIAHDVEKGFISDGDANAVIVFDPATLEVIRKIPLTGKDPDAIVYDSVSRRIFAFNGHSDNASVIDVDNLKEIRLLALGGGPEFAVPDQRGNIYNNLEDKSSLIVFSSRDLKLNARYPLAPCGGPTGLALDKIHQRAFSGCRANKGLTVTDMATGKQIATLSIGTGVDAVAYDPVTALIFCSCGDGTTTVIHQDAPDNYQVIQTIQTQYRAKTMGLDPQTHKIYLSVSDFQPGTKSRIPGSFHILVFQQSSQ